MERIHLRDAPRGDLSARAVVVDLDGVDWSRPAPRVRAAVAVGFSRSPLPPAAADVLRGFACTIAPDGPGRVWARGADAELEELTAAVDRNPQAAAVLADVLRGTCRASVPDALVTESLAYSLLLGGTEFAAWRSAHPVRGPVPVPPSPVRVSRGGDSLEVQLDVPERRNAFNSHVRDAVISALEIAEWDESIREVVLSGAGPVFCAGGDLDEFGTSTDLVAAHRIRVTRSAGLRVHGLRDRVHARVHGACIGAGIEVPAFASRITASPDTRFRLPEVAMGLIPGAGGTVGIPRRIGRWRTAYMALRGHDVDVATALEWGLVDARA